MMTTKTINIQGLSPAQPDSKKLVKIMTFIAWIILSVGVILCLSNITQFNDRNIGLMVGIGFLIGSVHIYVIGTAIGLVHSRAMNQAMSDIEES